MSNKLAPALIIEQANQINTLNQLLSWDLATATANHAGPGLLVHLQVQRGNNPPQNLWLNSRELEQLITDKIETLIGNLESSGINVEEIIAAYQSVGQQMLASQQNNQGVDTSKAP